MSDDYWRPLSSRSALRLISVLAYFPRQIDRDDAPGASQGEPVCLRTEPLAGLPGLPTGLNLAEQEEDQHDYEDHAEDS